MLKKFGKVLFIKRTSGDGVLLRYLLLRRGCLYGDGPHFLSTNAPGVGNGWVPLACIGGVVGGGVGVEIDEVDLGMVFGVV